MTLLTFKTPCSFLFLGRSTDLTERFEKRRKCIDLIVDLIEGLPPLDDPQVI